MDIQGDLAKLEYSIIAEFNPSYLSIVYFPENNTITIKLAKAQFQLVPIEDRIQYVFALLKFKHADIIKNHIICVMAYDDKEINELLGDVV